jgi:hypothetical protein
MTSPKPFLGITEDGMIVRYNPQIIIDPDSVIKRVANQSFNTIFNFESFPVAVDCSSEEIVYRNKSFHLSLTGKGQAIFWSYLPGMIFDTNFVLVQFGGKNRMIPAYSVSSSNSSISDRIFWHPKCVDEQTNGDFSLSPLLAIVIDYPSKNQNNGGPFSSSTRSSVPYMTPYFLLNLKNNRQENTVLNYLPPIPNIYPDGKVCMGHNFNQNFQENASTTIEIKRCIKWFYESKMNAHLINDSMNRVEASEKLFGWDDNKYTVPPIKNIQDVLKVKVGNFYVDGLPLNEAYSITGVNI